MTKSIRVTLGGKDLTLRGDNEETVKKSVREVNLQLQSLQQAAKDQGAQTLSLLTALNLAERCIQAEEGRAADIAYLTTELGKMTELLERAWHQPLT
ncbi:MAG: cell division protein ZapA [Flavobacteriales bacterium]|nr:MAG: cell division protein ZapA [Bacteroidota bacterium]KXK34007.1 MAG: Cell division protein ZapA [Chlorobi bacterium OLB6]MBE2266553.1 cell division protein ZapA [Flavobacteriales bacterium]MBV6464428.1 hypothetical protein [Chlorobiota bacterium]MBW7853973.1 cell division protein ZapA [Candidatus Kapabacteria bacterium]MCC6330356.1 cell division protein ZapA [Ignavibacteria bacterium]